jgi:FixJ family two-component response regulator
MGTEMKTKASDSRACNPLANVRHYGNHDRLTPTECVLLDALVDHGGVTKAARALGLGEKSTAARMATVREKIGAVSSADAMRIWKERRDAA